MLNNINNDSYIVILILLSITLLSLVGSVLVWLKIKKQEKQYNTLINVLRNEIQGMTGSSIGMGKRLLSVEKKLNIAVEKQVELENRDPGVLAYNQAARLLQKGADTEDLMTTCGIGRPEAELMALLHREVKSGSQQKHIN